MNSKELQDRIDGLERKLDRMQNIEERLEKAFQNVERFRDKMIQNGYSYAMLEEFNRAIQPITQHYNEIRKKRRKIAMLQEEQQRMAKEEKERNHARKAAIVAEALKPKEFPYNTDCRNFSFTDGEPKCEVKMDMQFCSERCPYTTTKPCSNKVDSKGRTVAYKVRKKGY